MIYVIIITNLLLSCLVFFLTNKLRKQKEENISLYNEAKTSLELCDSYKNNIEDLLNSYNELKIAINEAVKRGDYKIVISEKNYFNITNKNNYNVDDILNEIYQLGIENVDKDKIEYLKNIKYK